MGWEDAVVFEAVAAELSFTRAARRLHMSQPAVTKRVGRLEQQLDVRLLWRTTRRLAVTDAGHVVLGGIAEMRAEWSSVTQRLAWMLEEAVPPGSDDVTAQVRPIRRLPDLAVLPRWEDASAVQAVTEDGSFARAAVRLRTTRPALSQRVRRLERRLGTGVFDRSAQGLRPTAAGRVLLDGMNAALSVWERIESDVRRLAPARSLSPDSHAPASTSAKPATTPQQSRAQNIPFRDAASQDTVRGNKDTADGGGTPVQAMPRPAQLPADAAVFTGRTAALARLDRLLDAAAPAVVISTIDGSAGVGKTALAVHWAHRVRTWFPDGQLFLDLRGYSGLPPVRSVDALAVFLRSLGVPADQVPTGEQEAAALYRSLLADRRVLVVLDNAATVQQVRPLLPGGGDSLVLVTSRDRLGGLVARDGARRLNLDVLTAQEARAMLASVLGAERVLVDPDAVAGLIEACAYLPLALRIAAANLLDRPDVPTADYLAELLDGDRLAALAVDGDEQSAVRAAFDSSYRRLGADARRLLRLFGTVPVPDLTTNTAAVLIDADAATARRLLDRLAGAHLLQRPTSGRYSCHDLLRLYARQRAYEEDNRAERENALVRLRRHYLHTADTAVTLCHPYAIRLPLTEAAGRSAGASRPADQGAALAWLDAEMANLLAVVEQAAQSPTAAVAWQLGEVLRMHFIRCKRAAEWSRVAHAGLVAAETDGHPRALASAHFTMAVYRRMLGGRDEAWRHYELMLEFATRGGWNSGRAAALRGLGILHRYSGQLAQATAHFKRSLAIDDEDPRTRGSVLAHLGVIAWEVGQLSEAVGYLDEALGLHQEHGNLAAAASIRNDLAELHHLLGDLGQARMHLDHAAVLNQRSPDLANQAQLLIRLAALECDQGRPGNALEHAHAALRMVRETGDLDHETEILIILATIQTALGNSHGALEHQESALQLARDSNFTFPRVQALIGLAKIQHRCGHNQLAFTYGRQALEEATRFGYRALQGQALTALAAVHHARGAGRDALACAGKAVDLHHTHGHRLDHARAQMLLVAILTQLGHPTAAIHQQHTAALYRQIGLPVTGDGGEEGGS